MRLESYLSDRVGERETIANLVCLSNFIINFDKLLMWHLWHGKLPPRQIWLIQEERGTVRIYPGLFFSETFSVYKLSKIKIFYFGTSGAAPLDSYHFHGNAVIFNLLGLSIKDFITSQIVTNESLSNEEVTKLRGHLLDISKSRHNTRCEKQALNTLTPLLNE